MIGYPYRTLPRSLLAWLTTEAVRTKSRTIPLGESLSDFCRQLELPITGLQIRRLKDQARRLFNARLSVHYVEHLDISTETDPSPRGQRRQVRQEAGQNLLIASRYELWTTTQRNAKTADPVEAAGPAGKPATRQGAKAAAPRGAKQTAVAAEVALPSSVTLSAELYEEVTHRPVPVDIGALRLLRGSPLRLDVYTWLTYRMSYLRKPVVVTWEQLRFQFGTQVSTPRGYRHFRADFSEALRWVLAIYREAKVDEVANGIRLRPSPPHVGRGKRPALNQRT
ncbi:replication protein RepA [Kineococcus radiotolerans]|uniref:Plasmid encoded RepA protein n=1 Tax=Kineococcus radiotolerans (strain ATCC BAA-149 / DSM 14245 / SRS30216) TaxID=266940 RepID=A6WAH4_KINRD|nr:replication protein RepA [Kineococcus radiotolerans]ABS03813.1 plasmid encoded RepA protein [Kineococcus radiotolerans SRS30216 = ATCC BAA-149]